MIYFFYKIYGGFKVGYLRVFEVIYSQILSVCCVNFITYLQLCLIGRWRLGEHLTPMLAMMGIDLVIVVIWVVGMRYVDVYKRQIRIRACQRLDQPGFTMINMSGSTYDPVPFFFHIFFTPHFVRTLPLFHFQINSRCV